MEVHQQQLQKMTSALQSLAKVSNKQASHNFSSETQQQPQDGPQPQLDTIFQRKFS